jgi:hypothetical protein
MNTQQLIERSKFSDAVKAELLKGIAKSGKNRGYLKEDAPGSNIGWQVLVGCLSLYRVKSWSIPSAALPQYLELDAAIEPDRMFTYSLNIVEPFSRWNVGNGNAHANRPAELIKVARAYPAPETAVAFKGTEPIVRVLRELECLASAVYAGKETFSGYDRDEKGRVTYTVHYESTTLRIKFLPTADHIRIRAEALGRTMRGQNSSKGLSKSAREYKSAASWRPDMRVVPLSAAKLAEYAH